MIERVEEAVYSKHINLSLLEVNTNIQNIIGSIHMVISNNPNPNNRNFNALLQGASNRANSEAYITERTTGSNNMLNTNLQN